MVSLQCRYVRHRFICWEKAVIIFNFQPLASLHASPAPWSWQTLATKMIFILPHLCFVCIDVSVLWLLLLYLSRGSYWHFIYLPYKKIRSERRENLDVTACHLFPFSYFSACLAETPNSRRADKRQSRLFYPHPHPSGMTSCLCYLAPYIKLRIPIAAFFFFFFFLICPCSESRLCTPTCHPDCADILRLEYVPALSFIYHRPSKRAGSWGEWGEDGTSFILISRGR